jgi:hypothetical protein
MASGIVDGLCTMGPTVGGKRVDGGGLDGRRQRGRHEDEVYIREFSEGSSLAGGDEGDGFGEGNTQLKTNMERSQQRKDLDGRVWTCTAKTDWLEVMARLRFVFRLQDRTTFERLHPNYEEQQKVILEDSGQCCHNAACNVPGVKVDPTLAMFQGVEHLRKLKVVADKTMHWRFYLGL